MKTGLYISGGAHAALILWLLFGSLFLSEPEEDLLQVSEVSILSSEEFAALSAPEAAPVAAVAPVTSPAAPARPVAPVPEPEPVAPPMPEPEPTPTPVAPEPPEVAPVDIDRVAPDAAPVPSPEAEIAPVVQDEAVASETGDEPQPEAPATAPEAATTEIVTEATDTADLAPTASMRPPARPTRPEPAPTPEAEPTPTPTPETAATDPVADAVADAVAEAIAGTQTGTAPSAPQSTGPTGPPLSRGQMNALRVAVGTCWNVGSLSSEALQTTVVLAVSMNPDATPDINSIRMVSFTGGTEAAARRAYETARRAIIRCGATGFNLPREKYEHWKEINMTFNPENMRIR